MEGGTHFQALEGSLTVSARGDFAEHRPIYLEHGLGAALGLSLTWAHTRENGAIPVHGIGELWLQSVIMSDAKWVSA